MTAAVLPKSRAAPNVMICIPCLLVGGTEIHTKLLAGALARGGYNVCVCVYYEFDPLMVAAVESTGARVRLLRLKRGPGRTPAKPFRLLFALAIEMRRYRPDFVHVQYMTPGIAPLAVARMLGVPHVLATVHVTANHYQRVWLPRNLAMKLCDVLICVSHVAERSFFGEAATFCEQKLKLSRRHFTIPNGVDLSAIDAILAEGPQDELAQALKLSGPVIGIVGRLDRHKGHDLLLRAFAMVRARHPGAQLLCVGDGAERERLIHLTDELHLTAHVIFTGGLPQAQALRHMSLMDIVAMPSRPGLEGFGLSAAEALAMGKPLVASDVDGLTEVVGRHGSGMLIAPENVTVLAAAIDRLLSNPELRERMSISGRKRVQQHFTIELFAKRHLDLYQAVAAANRRCSSEPAAGRLAGDALPV